MAKVFDPEFAEFDREAVREWLDGEGEKFDEIQSRLIDLFDKAQGEAGIQGEERFFTIKVTP